MTYLGYHDEHSLPIKAGDTVTIPKGVTITNVRFGDHVAAKTYKVRVHHVMPGQSVKASWQTDSDVRRLEADGVDLTEYHDAYNTLKELSDKRDIEFAKEVKDTDYLDRLEKARLTFYSLWIPTVAPRIVWVGAGGYWSELDINTVLPKDNV